LHAEPEYPKLVTWLKRVPQWQFACPHLLDDKDGTKTEEISMMDGGVKEKCNEMLSPGRFLRMSNPTWKKIVDALRLEDCNGMADDIESELQG